MKNRLNVDVRMSLKASGALTAEATHSKAVPAPRHSGVFTRTVLNQPESVMICCKIPFISTKIGSGLLFFCGVFPEIIPDCCNNYKQQKMDG